jgi:EAL domain-containing protein (putative c-di-GMP-specific phosphodiesterase class I)
MGPDEHDAVLKAFEAFKADNGPGVVDYDLGDSRSAVLFRAVNAQRRLAGAIMVVMDSRGVKHKDQGAARLMTPKLQRALSAFVAMRPGSPHSAPARPATAPARTATATATAPARPAAAAPRQAAPPSAPAREPRAANSPPPALDRLHAALRRSPIGLHVQRLVPLTKGSELQRYEVLLRSKSDDAPNVAPHAMLKAAVEHGLGSMIDRRVLSALIGFLMRHPAIWQKQPVLFSVNLTSTALQDEHFMKFVELCLAKSLLPKAIIAFEIDVATAMRFVDQVTDVAKALHRLGCPLVLDDFGMRTECFDLLRLPSVQYIKLAPDITAKMRSDKLSQAAITAVVQMARVLGMHTVAKRTETAAEQEWLTALGVDFIQSNALSPPISIQSLVRRGLT